MENYIKVHTEYTYETSDGREFNDKEEAVRWQQTLSVFNTIKMLDYEFEPTKDVKDAVYVRIVTPEQAEAFNEVSDYAEFMSNKIPGIGYYRYDDYANRFVSIQSEIETLQSIIELLNTKEKEND